MSESYEGIDYTQRPGFAHRADLDRRYFMTPPKISEEILEVLEDAFSDDEETYPTVKAFCAAYRASQQIAIPELRDVVEEHRRTGGMSLTSRKFAEQMEQMLDLYEEMRRRCGWLFTRVFLVPDTTIPVYCEHRSAR